MDWTTCIILTVAWPGVAAGVVWLGVIAMVVVLCRAAALGDRHHPRERAPAADAPPCPPPRTPHELVACALVTLDVEHATLFAGTRPDRLRALARGHLDARADAEPPELHADAAAAALRDGAAVEVGGIAPAPVVAAAPVLRRGRVIGALAVSARRPNRGRLTFAERRALAQP